LFSQAECNITTFSRCGSLNADETEDILFYFFEDYDSSWPPTLKKRSQLRYVQI
jgi:hypothetical protein